MSKQLKNEKYFDGFIAEQEAKGEKLTPEIYEVNARLNWKDLAKEAYANRDFWCRIGLHNRLQTWYGGGVPKTCVKCRRHLL